MTLPTDDDKVRMILDVFKFFNVRAGEVLMPHNIIARQVANNLGKEDVSSGLELARKRGLIEHGPNGSIRLTPAGFAEI